MSLVVRVDAEQFMPTHKGFAQTVTARNIWGRASKTNVVLDQYTGVLMCKPLQFYDDWEVAGTVTRYPISAWTGDTTHWDDVLNSVGSGNGILNADNAAGKITTSTTFDVNTSFLVSFFHCGTSNDRTPGIEFEFGQWKLVLSTSGDATLSRGGVTRYADIISDPISDQMVELVIMPYVNNSLLIRRINGYSSGMLVSLNAELDTSEMVADPPEIISAGKFSVTPKSVACKQFSLTELTYDTEADYELVSPVLDCIWPPSAAMTQSVVGDSLTNYGGVAGVGLWDKTTDTLFAADSAKHEYRAVFLLTPLAHKTTMIRGLTFGFTPEARAALTEAADVSDDVRSIEINVDSDASQTEALIDIRNPESYGLFGACSRLCTIEIDGNQILRGILAEPPVYTYTENGDRYYSLRVQSIYRYIQTASIVNELNLAGQVHSDAMGWICFLSSLAPNDVEFGITTDIIPLGTSADGQISTDWTIKPFDSGETWVKKICDETGWVLTDGINGGVYVLRYLDPLEFDSIPKHTYHMNSQYETGANQRVHAFSTYSIEPEANEFHLIFCNEAGEKCDAVYYDAASANGSLAVSDRPSNWLGFVKRGGIDIGQRSEAVGQALSLRIGAEVARRVDMMRIAADWPIYLWVNDTITIADEDLASSGNYRIRTMGIKISSEIAGREVRTCDILAELLA